MENKIIWSKRVNNILGMLGHNGKPIENITSKQKGKEYKATPEFEEALSFIFTHKAKS